MNWRPALGSACGWANRGIRPDIAVCGLAVLIVLVAVRIWRLMPIYPDEVAFQMVAARFFSDLFDRGTLMPFCNAGMNIPGAADLCSSGDNLFAVFVC